MPRNQRAAECVVCGRTPTVRSHLFPRSLVRRLWGADKYAVAGDRSRSGVTFTQGGLWDDELLCEAHEAILAPPDNYAVRFCRRLDNYAVLESSGKWYTVPNPQPDLLLRFACSAIWRHVTSKHGSKHGLNLGPYRQSFENYLFGSSGPPVEAFVGRSNLTNATGERIELGVAPYKNKFRDWTIWMFTVGGLDFYVKTDQRPFPVDWRPFLLNDNDPVALPLIDPLRFDEIPKFRPIFAQMTKRRSARPQ